MSPLFIKLNGKAAMKGCRRPQWQRSIISGHDVRGCSSRSCPDLQSHSNSGCRPKCKKKKRRYTLKKCYNKVFSMLLCHSADNKIKSQCSLCERSKAIMPLTRENVDAKLIQQLMKRNISSLKRKISTSKDKGLMMRWLYITLFVRYMDAKCCKEKPNRLWTIVSRGVAAREGCHQSCFLYRREKDKKMLCRRMLSNCPASEYSEKENIACQGQFGFKRICIFVSPWVIAITNLTAGLIA